MTDLPTPPRSEPVAILDLVKLVLAVAAAAGVTVSEDIVFQAVIAANALFLFVATTLATRRRVTPVARADAHLAEALAKLEVVEAVAVAHEREAYEEGLAVGEHEAAPTATVVEVSDLDRILAALKKQAANPLAEPAPPAPPPPRPEPKPPAGLYDPDEPIITDTDGPGLPWAPTRQPPPPGLD